MKKYMKRILGIILMIVAVGAVSNILQDLILCRNDGDSFRIKAFHREPADSLDFVVMGASEVMCGFLAPEAYKITGLTSYSYAFPVNPAQIWKYELHDIEQAQHPKLLIVETNGALYTEKKHAHSNYCVNTLADNMPMSKNRIDIAFELSKHPLESLFPIIKYHYKWPKIRELDTNRNLMLRKQGYAKLRGAQSFLYHKEEPPKEILPIDDTTADLHPYSEAELAEFLEECKKSDIENILFVEFPHLIGDKKHYERQQRANKAAEMIRDAGFEYISLMDAIDEMELDPEKDFTDSDHLTAPGQKKLTTYLSNLIMDKYGLEPMAQTEKNKARWEESAELIDCYYELYDEYTTAHKDEPYKKAEFTMSDNVRTIKELERIREAKKKQ